tara:strand:+ start:562 stop:1182 length:621 start_codon:yes stop_codon:yes gene_type:complete
MKKEINKKLFKEFMYHMDKCYELEGILNLGSLMHNYGWREHHTAQESRTLFEGLHRCPGLHGIDAESKECSNVEMKSCKSKILKSGKISSSAKFEWDKQNDKERRENTLKSNGFVFSLYEKAKLLIQIIIKDKKGTQQMKEILIKKQKEFLKMVEDCKKTNKRIPRDSICVSLHDLIEVETAVILKDNSTHPIEDWKEFFSDGSRR